MVRQNHRQHRLDIL